MEKNSHIYVAGHRGLAGSAIVRALRRGGYERLILCTRAELDLSDKGPVERFFAAEQPEYVFLAAAKVGGILANSTYPADFLRDNLAIELNVIDSAYRHGCRKLLFLGSSSIYPKLAPQPSREEYMLTGPLEPASEWYAIAKIAGIKMAQAYRQQYGFNAISLVPTNLYGPGDKFDLAASHLLPAFIRRFHEAKIEGRPEVVLWGTGSPRRELLHADDLAEAALLLMREYDSPEIINVGTGEDLTIREIAEIVREAVGYTGAITYDTSKPDGTPRKLLDVSRLKGMGWSPRIVLTEGIAETYRWFVENHAAVKA
jgi:GDP-L-fucose synthase